jgi:4'-phosphopantetheinyl transferase
MNRPLIEAAPGIWVAMAHGAPPEGHLTDRDLTEAGPLPAHRAAQRLAGRKALRGLLAQRFFEAWDADVVYGPRGRPELAGWPRIGVSVSHDGDAAAACAALDHAVGVDVQHPPETVEDALVRRCARERSGDLTRLPVGRRTQEFAWMWTAQEACVKAEGTGLSGSPWAIDIPPLTTRGSWGAYRWVNLREQVSIPLSCAFAESSALSALSAVPADPTRLEVT